MLTSQPEIKITESLCGRDTRNLECIVGEHIWKYYYSMSANEIYEYYECRECTATKEVIY